MVWRNTFMHAIPQLWVVFIFSMLQCFLGANWVIWIIPAVMSHAELLELMYETWCFKGWRHIKENCLPMWWLYGIVGRFIPFTKYCLAVLAVLPTLRTIFNKLSYNWIPSHSQRRPPLGKRMPFFPYHPFRTAFFSIPSIKPFNHTLLI